MSRYSELTPDEQGSLCFDPELLVQAIEVDNGLLDELHALKYGEQPRGLGWAWRQAEGVAPSTVRINCMPYTFDPLTRRLTPQ